MWSPLTLSMYPQIEEIRLNAQRFSASHAFPSLFLWQESMGLSILLEQDAYLIRQRCRGEQHYFFPCGEAEGKRKLLQALPAGSVLHYADADDLSFLRSLSLIRFSAAEARDDWEYLCDRRQQLELSGKAFRDLRRNVNRSRRLPGWTAEPLTQENLPEALALEAQWQAQGGAFGDARVAADGLANYAQLHLSGVLVRLAGQAVGYSFGAILSPDTFFGIIIRALEPAFYAGLRWETYQALPPQITTVNLEEDLGLEGLRNNKLMMRPVGFLKLSNILLEGGSL